MRSRSRNRSSRQLQSASRVSTTPCRRTDSPASRRRPPSRFRGRVAPFRSTSSPAFRRPHSALRRRSRTGRRRRTRFPSTARTLAPRSHRSRRLRNRRRRDSPRRTRPRLPRARPAADDARVRPVESYPQYGTADQNRRGSGVESDRIVSGDCERGPHSSCAFASRWRARNMASNPGFETGPTASPRRPNGNS